MEHLFTRPNKTYPFAFSFLVSLFVLMNACTVAKYDFAIRDTNQRNEVVPASYGGPVHFVIQQYYQIDRCGWGDLTPCRNSTGDRLGAGVRNGLQGIPAQFTDSIPRDGLACVVRVEQEPPENRYSELVAAATLFVLPAYTTRKYVLSYAVLQDKKEIITYRYDITERALTGLLTWVLAPVVPFAKDIHMGLFTDGPLSGVIRDATMNFVEIEARPSGVFFPLESH